MRVPAGATPRKVCRFFLSFLFLSFLFFLFFSVYSRPGRISDQSIGIRWEVTDRQIERERETGGERKGKERKRKRKRGEGRGGSGARGK